MFCATSLLQFSDCRSNTRMPIADQAYIRTCGNHVTLDKFKEPVPTSSILILNECECYRNPLVVALNSDCSYYRIFIFYNLENVVYDECSEIDSGCADS